MDEEFRTIWMEPGHPESDWREVVVLEPLMGGLRYRILDGEAEIVVSATELKELPDD